jgi:hypothetical protein
MASPLIVDATTAQRHGAAGGITIAMRQEAAAIASPKKFPFIARRSAEKMVLVRVVTRE